jgi:uncharacterized membrane protein
MSITTSTRPSRSYAVLLLFLAILAYALCFSYLTLTRYWAFEARSLDMGNLDQAVWNTAHGRPFHLTNQPGTINRLSLHVEPILLPIALLYWIYSGPPTLLVLQATGVALGAWPLFLLARHKLHSEWLALVFGLAWLLNPTLQAANWIEFHPVTLAPTFLVATFYCLVAGKLRGYVLCAILAAGCKEEIALLIFMIGLYAWLFLHRRRLGLITMTLALLWALTAVLVIQNTFAAGNIHWERYAYLGETPLHKVLTLLTRPDLVWAQLGQAQALAYLALLLFPVGFLTLLGPEILLLALPSLAINLLADYAPMHEVTTLMYAAPVVPFVLIGAVWGTGRVVRPESTRELQIGKVSTIFGCGLILLSSFSAQFRYGYLPGGGNYQHYLITDHHRRAEELIAQIPPDAKVTAQDKLNPHVSGRETIYIFPRVEDADTIWLDVTGSAWPQHPNDLHRTVTELLAGDFGVQAAADGYLLLGRGVATKTLPEPFFSAWQRPAFTPALAHQLDFGGVLRLVDYVVTTDAHGELVTQLYWQTLKPMAPTVRFYVAYLAADWTVLHDTQFYPPVAQLWYPTSQWKPGETVLVQTLPWTLTVDRFVLVVGLYTGAEDWQSGQRLPVDRVEPPLPRLPGDLVRLGGYQRTDEQQWVARPLTPAAPAQPLRATFGEQIVLEGVTITTTALSAGATLPFTLFWRAQQPATFDYNLFAHLLDEADNKVAQLDWQPHDAISQLPATAWIVGQPVVDTQSLTLPPTLPPGNYRLIVGWYNWQDNKRLPATGPHSAAGDVVMVAHLAVK